MRTLYPPATIGRANALLDRLATLRVWLAPGYMPYLHSAVTHLEALEPVLQAVLDGKPIEVSQQEDGRRVWQECIDPGFTLPPSNYRVKPLGHYSRRFLAFNTDPDLAADSCVKVATFLGDPPSPLDVLHIESHSSFCRWLDSEWLKTPV